QELSVSCSSDFECDNPVCVTFPCPVTNRCVEVGSCTPSVTAACLQGNRFKVDLEWSGFNTQQGGNARSVQNPQTADSTLFYFFGQENWELLAKVIDGCSSNDHFWVFGAAATTLAYSLRVVDTETGVFRSYENL